MINLTLFDTSAATDNLGDEIIIDAVQQIIYEVLPNAYVYRVATHEYMAWISRRILKKSSLCIVGGTNLLSRHMGPFGFWRITPWDTLVLNHAILLGVGWKNYLPGPNAYTRWLLNRILSKEHIHSIRDSYTKGKLAAIARRVVNTACPTMWSLTPEHCAEIPSRKANKVVTTLSHYRADPVNDRLLLDILAQNYKEVYFWPQQSDDEGYLASLGATNVKRIPPTVHRYNAFLDNEAVDFVGSRLHGGIRAMQKRKRSLILAVDNRATEISKDCNLGVLDRTDIAGIQEWIGGDRPTSITLPTDEIAVWKAQFQ